MPKNSRPTGVPGEELDYAEITAAVAPATTTEGTATTVVASNAVTYDGSPVIIEFQSPAWRPDSAGAGRTMQLVLVDSVAGVIDGNLALIKAPAATAADEPCSVKRRFTPSPGLHTFTVKAFVSAGTGNIDAGAGGTGASTPAFLRVTRA